MRLAFAAVGGLNAFTAMFQLCRYFETKDGWHIVLGIMGAVAASVMYFQAGKSL